MHDANKIVFHGIITLFFEYHDLILRLIFVLILLPLDFPLFPFLNDLATIPFIIFYHLRDSY